MHDPGRTEDARTNESAKRDDGIDTTAAFPRTDGGSEAEAFAGTDADRRYFERLEADLETAMTVAETARQRGGDPEPHVEIPIATDMADRVENLLDIDGLADRIRDLEAGDRSREEAALALAADFAEGTVGDYETRAGVVEGAVRTAVALLTEGVVAAPIEGIDGVELLENDDGTEFVNVYYAGPIRSAGGTAQALSVLVADYTRALLEHSEYRPRPEEVERYVEEVSLYDDETGLQYTPSDAETRYIARNLPVMLDGEATGDDEVSGYRDLDRIDTNRARGGMCLVLAEGIAQKAPKIQRYTDALDAIDWPWLEDLIEGTVDADAEGNDAEEGAQADEESDRAGDADGTTVGDGNADGMPVDDGNADGMPVDDGNADGMPAGDGDDASENETTNRRGPADDTTASDVLEHAVDGTDTQPSGSGVARSDADRTGAGPDGPARPDPSKKFLSDLIAGRPVLSHPSAPGGFRLRYGRARNHGFATAGVHPATMHLVEDFLATGTQLKTERPGKAAGVIPVDSIEGPTVKLANGDVRRIDDPETAIEVRNGVVEILDLGEYLVNYGEFVENNHPLVPAGYTVEWWEKELEAAGADVQALRDSPHVDLADPPIERALQWALAFDVPLHPVYTYQWHDLSVDALDRLATAVASGRLVVDDGRSDDAELADWTLALEPTDEVREALETIVIEHRQRSDRIEVDDPVALLLSVGCVPVDDAGEAIEFRARSTGGESGADPAETDTEGGTVTGGEAAERVVVPETVAGIERTWSLEDLSETARHWAEGDNAVEAVIEIAPFVIRERAPTRIGGRMGRPEKSERRELSPAVHVLFPIGSAGGDQRDISKAAEHAADRGDRPGVVEVSICRRRCRECDAETSLGRCPDCDSRTELEYRCPECDQTVDAGPEGGRECPRCEIDATPVDRRPVDVGGAFEDALESVGLRQTAFDICKGVKGLTSTAKVPEPLEKGVLRARHDVSAFKDGTIRYDMTDLPVTAVRPAELDVTVDQLRALGYDRDIEGDPLEHPDQLVELKVQDVVLSDGAAEYMLQTANFVDDLLERYYGMEPFYELENRDDLVGELVFGMAPHTSAAVVGRVIGFTSAAVGYAHPYFHASKRRNCDGDEDCVMLLLDGLLNFSRHYLPSSRGGRMDAPLVMTSRIDPTEIDDEAHNVDVVSEYPLEFYEATREMADPGEVDVEIAEDSLGTETAYSGFEFTHDTSDIALGPDLSAYKTLGSMTDKMDSQLELARKLHAVDETDVAERVIEYHFLPDLIGNLRAFTSQELRCVDCGEKFRRVPLTEVCRECGGNVTLTVHEGSVTKYLQTATDVAVEYGCREYTKQRLEVLDRSIESLFENDKNKQSGIADFM